MKTGVRTVARRLRILALVASASFLLAAADLRAQGLQQEVGGRTTVKLNDIATVRDALGRIGLGGSLGNLELAGVAATDSTVAGFVNFIAMRWNFLFFKDGLSSYFALEPVNAQGQPRTPKLSDFFRAPGIEVTDMMTFDRVALVIAASEAKLARDKLPAAAKAVFDPYFDNPVSPVDLELGLNYFGMADLGKLAPLKSAIEAIGGQSTKVLFKAKLQPSALDNLVKGQLPEIKAKFQATLPPIRPSIGGKITLPATFTMGLIAETSGQKAKLGFFGEAEVPFAYPNIARKRVDTARTVMALEVAMGVDGGKPTSSISAAMFKGEQGAFKQAFGLPFLDLQDYTMKFEVKADAVAVEIGAGGRFYTNKIETLAAVQVPAASAGIPLPDQIKFMVVPANPAAIGSLSLRDLTNAFADLTAAVTGASVPHAPLPDNFVRIQGAAAGQGPFVDVNLDIGIDAGLSMGGALIVWGKEIARIDVAEVRPTSGIEIKAKTNAKLPLDIIDLPVADVDVKVTKDNIDDPHVRIAVQSATILGSDGRFELSIDKRRQIGIMEGATPFKLFKAALVLDSETQSMQRQNFTVTGIVEGDFFNKLADGLTAATADLVKGTDSAVATMNSAVHDLSQRMAQAKIDKSVAVNNLERARKSAYAEFESAKARVESVYRAYQSESSDCDGWPWNWHHCAAAGTLWLSYQTAKGVLSVAQRAVDGFLQGTGAALSAVVNGLNAAIAGFGQALEATTSALGTVMKTAAKTLDIGAKLAGKALEAVASVFDIEKLWMKGALAILHAQQSGQLGIEYTLLGKQYLTDVAWDFKIPIDQIVEVFKPGSRPAVKPMVVAPGYAFPPSTTDIARAAADDLLKKAEHPRTVRVPFDPGICQSNPYAIDEQIAQIKEEQASFDQSVRNADVYKWVQAIEASKTFLSGGSGGGGLTWVAASGGRVPSAAVAGGAEPARTLYVCRGRYGQGNNVGLHPGKIVANACNIGWGGREVQLSSYEVLTAPGVGGQPQWRTMPGAAHDIGVGANGAIWVIGTNAEGNDYGIYRWDNNNWSKIPGSAVRIAVDPAGVAWVVQKGGGIYYYHPNGWQHVPGGAHDIGIGANGAVWVIGANPEVGGYGIYRRTGNSWTKIPGSAVRIAVDPAGNAWS